MKTRKILKPPVTWCHKEFASHDLCANCLLIDSLCPRNKMTKNQKELITAVRCIIFQEKEQLDE